MRYLFSFLLASILCLPVTAQLRVTLLPQHHFPKTIPAGDYSGITWLGGDRYAVVSDKPEHDGFFIFEIKIDKESGEITDARNLGFQSSGIAARDEEGIAADTLHQRLWISGEGDNQIREYTIDGRLTERVVPLPTVYAHLPGNEGLEALSFNAVSRTLWTCNETAPVTITAFNDSLQPIHQYPYPLDEAEGEATAANHYAHGIGTLLALSDSTLLVLEREFFVPHSKIGAWVHCKLFQYTPPTDGRPANKRLLTSWRTTLTLFGRSLANYEGMCLGPRLNDGSRVLLMVADSQHRYAGVLRDWFRSARLSEDTVECPNTDKERVE